MFVVDDIVKEVVGYYLDSLKQNREFANAQTLANKGRAQISAPPPTSPGFMAAPRASAGAAPIPQGSAGGAPPKTGGLTLSTYQQMLDQADKTGSPAAVPSSYGTSATQGNPVDKTGTVIDKTGKAGGGSSVNDILSGMGQGASIIQAVRSSMPQAPSPGSFGSAASIPKVQPTSTQFTAPAGQRGPTINELLQLLRR